jgi:hypothetical protein
VPRNPNRISGIRAKRRREAKRLLRDRKIYRFLQFKVRVAKAYRSLFKRPIEPLSVYIDDQDHRHAKVLSPFPIRNLPRAEFPQSSHRPMPQWNDLSRWLKMQLAVMLMDEWTFQTFNIHIHPDLEKEWVKESRDVRVMMRDRLRRELDKLVRPGLEHFFVIEGWSKLTRAPTMLHIHGAAAIYPGEPRDARNIMLAAGRAAGHGLKGYSRRKRAVHGQMFTRAGPRYINYLLKAVNRKDDRLNDRRVTMSRSVVKATRELWEKDITGRVKD